MLIVGNLYKGILDHNVPMVFLSGLFTIIGLFVVFEKSPKELEKPKEVVNQKKHTYSFNTNSIDFLNFKNEVKNFYQPLGFTKIVIDKENSWMLENDEHVKAYILASRKNSLIYLEVYNAPAFNMDEKTSIVKETSNKNEETQ